MSNDVYEKDWRKFLKCKECWEFKEVCWDNRYSHSQWFLWVLWRCKDCIKKWRQSEKERAMARKRDYDRYHNNADRNSYIKKTTAERRKRKWYWPVHLKTDRLIKKLWVRPEKCPICWKRTRIVAHHPNYLEWNKIVFCCTICHSKIHRWIITEYIIMDLFSL